MGSESPAESPFSSGSASQTDTGFKSFWKKTKQDLSHRGAKSGQQDVSKKKAGKSGRSVDASSAVQKRRDQVYQAQKRHRDRKAEYVKTLEREVARLQHLDALVSSQRNVLIHQNEAFREYFEAQSLSIPFDLTNFSPASPPSSTSSPLGSVKINVRFDPEIGHERTFMDLSDTDESHHPADASTVSDSLQTLSVSAQKSRPAAATNWLVLDFILALEWPCQNHHAHGAINPEAVNPHAPSSGTIDPNLLHGHALTMTAAVYQSAQPVGVVSSAGTAEGNDTWEIPHSEIDKLVALSENLDLDDEQTTPAQAYAYVKKLVASDQELRAVLRNLKGRLSSSVACFGFGAAVSTTQFIDEVHLALQSGL